jgi:hypothetical protein
VTRFAERRKAARPPSLLSCRSMPVVPDRFADEIAESGPQPVNSRHDRRPDAMKERGLLAPSSHQVLRIGPVGPPLHPTPRTQW